LPRSSQRHDTDWPHGLIGRFSNTATTRCATLADGLHVALCGALDFDRLLARAKTRHEVTAGVYDVRDAHATIECALAYANRPCR
jgi:4'-phosphopantetheinyl transferase EntD